MFCVATDCNRCWC